MGIFFTEDTLINLVVIVILLGLLILNGLIIYRVSQVKIKASKPLSDKLLSFASTLLIIGVLLWLAMNVAEIGIGSIILIGVLGVTSKILSPMATGLTDQAVQYEGAGATGNATIFTNITRTVFRLPYEKIQNAYINEADEVELEVKQKIRTVRVHFPIEKKEEVERFLNEKNVL